MLEDMGFEIEASHHEVANGQHEIDFKYDGALNAADNIVTFKLVVKTVAHMHDMYATFMPVSYTHLEKSGKGGGVKDGTAGSQASGHYFWRPAGRG